MWSTKNLGLYIIICAIQVTFRLKKALLFFVVVILPCRVDTWQFIFHPIVEYTIENTQYFLRVEESSNAIAWWSNR